MSIVENTLDSDYFITSLYTPGVYTTPFLSLLSSPSTTTLNTLAINDLPRLVSGLKHLIKYKYDRLKNVIRKNICHIVVLLLDYNTNIDTLLINLLRNDSYVFSKNILKHKYFSEYKKAESFIIYHMYENKVTIDITDDNINNEYGRDFYGGSKFIQTHVSYLSSGISVELETNILFLSSVSTNVSFYINLLISKYILDTHKAKRVIRFIVARRLISNNIILLLREIVNKYRDSIIWIFYDVLYYNGEESISDIVWHFEYKGNNDTIRRTIQDNLKRLRNKEMPTKDVTHDIPTSGDIICNIRDMTFDKYYVLVQNMKSSKKAYIPYEIYRDIILASFVEDNYVQVYLWKILLYQKILFGMEIEVDESELLSEESKEGYDIYISM